MRKRSSNRLIDVWSCLKKRCRFARGAWAAEVLIRMTYLRKCRLYRCSTQYSSHPIPFDAIYNRKGLGPACRGAALEPPQQLLADSGAFRQNMSGPLRDPSMKPPTHPNTSLFTIGHSSLELDIFINVIVTHEIRVLCDVRSRPGSFRFPQFNREPLEACLTTAEIRYEFLGEALGGRPSDPAHTTRTVS